MAWVMDHLMSNSYAQKPQGSEATYRSPFSRDSMCWMPCCIAKKHLSAKEKAFWLCQQRKQTARQCSVFISAKWNWHRVQEQASCWNKLKRESSNWGSKEGLHHTSVSYHWKSLVDVQKLLSDYHLPGTGRDRSSLTYLATNKQQPVLMQSHDTIQKTNRNNLTVIPNKVMQMHRQKKIPCISGCSLNQLHPLNWKPHLSQTPERMNRRSWWGRETDLATTKWFV